MKKVLLLFVLTVVGGFVVLSTVSCKKKTYTCKCSGIIYSIEAISKSAAENLCKDMGSSCTLQ